VISGAADRGRAVMALDSAWRELVREGDGVVLLLTPPFSGAGPDPGYIAAYPPGVRENGGQYTHAAAWLVRALANVGDGERAGALLRLLLPTRHAEGVEGTRRYRVEPYVIAADVYGAEPHVGRGGWTWYTGSAGWIWRVALEDVLGIRREGRTLSVDPCIPVGWGEFEVEIQIEGVMVAVRVRNPDGVSRGVRSCIVGGRGVDHLKIPLPTLGESGAATGDAESPFLVEVTLGANVP
jgi:cyclic beta-1,2-glucan synthetase